MQPEQTVPSLRNVDDVIEQFLAHLSQGENEELEQNLKRLRLALLKHASSSRWYRIPSNGLQRSKKPLQSYLTKLPPKALQCIVRHLSNRPRSVCWKKSINTGVAEQLYCYDDEVAREFRKTFRYVAIDSVSSTPLMIPLTAARFPRRGDVKSLKRKMIPLDPAKHPMFLRTHSVPSGAVRVFECAGSSLERVRCNVNLSKEQAPHRINWILPFREHCASVIHLELSGIPANFLEIILSHRSGKLKSLALGYTSSEDEHMECVAKHGAGLRQFKLAMVRSTETRLWEVLGPTLEDLELSFLPQDIKGAKGPGPYPLSSYIRTIQDQCRCVRRITVTAHPPKAVDDIERWFRSYALGLEYAFGCFPDMPPDGCIRIADACPNAVFEFSSLKKAVTTVRDLRFRVQKLCIEEYHPGIAAEASLISNNCHRLERLEMKNFDESSQEVLAALLHVQKPRLFSVELSLKADCGEQVFRLLAQLTTTIIDFSITMSTMNVTGLAGFLAANRMMRCIMLTLEDNPKNFSFAAVLTVIQNCVEHSPELRSLIVVRPLPDYSLGEAMSTKDMKSIADACVPFRIRNTHVHVCGIDFL